MELYVLPLLALLGLVFLIDGGDDADTDPPEPEPEDEFNYMPFGPEDDVATGTDANDAMYMGVGDDRATGGAGDDRIFFADGQDSTTELAADGSFETAGMEGDDFIRGGDGRDILVDALGANTIYGDTGYDRMNSIDAEGDEGTADTMYGGFGEDVLFADNGDVLSGGGQDDRFQITATDNMDPVTITDFAEGDQLFLRDEDGGFQVIERITTDLSESGEDTNVMLDGEVVMVLQGVTTLAEGAIGNPTAPAMFGEAETDEAGNILNDDFNDTIVIDDYTHAVFARGGDDTIGFAEGAETEDRDIRVLAGAGDDVVAMGLGDDSISGGLGNDVIEGGGGSDEINGGYGNDVITTLDDDPGANADIVDGGNGADTLIGDNGDALTGGAGVDAFTVDMTDVDNGVVTINDFDPATETLAVQYLADNNPAPTVTVSVAQDATGAPLGTLISLYGAQVDAVVLIGVDPADVDPSDIAVIAA